jgi:hypothetical protein
MPEPVRDQQVGIAFLQKTFSSTENKMLLVTKRWVSLVHPENLADADQATRIRGRSDSQARYEIPRQQRAEVDGTPSRRRRPDVILRVNASTEENDRLIFELQSAGTCFAAKANA